MKQLLLRVDDELHARLTLQARAAGKSVNALANEVLGLAIDPANLSRRDRLQLRLIAVGEIGRNRPRQPEPYLPPLSQEELEALRERALESMRGVGPIGDELIDYQRGPK
jgi:plasmid stability protein